MFEQWLKMEQFYFNDMWIFIITSCLLGIVAFPLLSYVKKRPVQIIFLIFTVFWIISGVFVSRGWNEHQQMIDEFSYVNAANRSYEKKIFSDFSYPYTTMTLYKTSYMKEYFDSLSLYEATTMNEPIEYKGTDGNYFYLEINNRIYYTSDKLVTFSDEVIEPQRVGTVYKLIDDQFQSIGFIDTSANYLEGYVIPETMRSLEVSEDDLDRAEYHSDQVIRNWVSP